VSAYYGDVEYLTGGSRVAYVNQSMPLTQSISHPIQYSNSRLAYQGGSYLTESLVQPVSMAPYLESVHSIVPVATVQPIAVQAPVYEKVFQTVENIQPIIVRPPMQIIQKLERKEPAARAPAEDCSRFQRRIKELEDEVNSLKEKVCKIDIIIYIRS
jgi:hypothetical protein